jgi:hypothetical protein
VAFVNPARYANEQQALHPRFEEHHGSPPPRRRRRPIRNLVNLVTGRRAKRDR